MELSLQYGAHMRDRVNAELAGCVAEWFPELPPPDQEVLRRILAGGKRLRACLACLVAQALGARMEAAMPAALAIEMVHAASLVHDDFVDGDALRHGKPAAWTVLEPRRAVLLADMMFATAIEKMAQCGAAEVGALAQAIAATARGAFQETLEREASYRRVNQAKTGSLFAAAARLGALAARASDAEVESAHQFGALVGEAYQLADDLADGVPAGVNPHAEGDIAALLERAKAALAAFPDGESTRLLAEAPGEFVRRALTMAEPYAVR
jgi:geranylgeranyl pyrophosphate synthase